MKSVIEKQNTIETNKKCVNITNVGNINSNKNMFDNFCATAWFQIKRTWKLVLWLMYLNLIVYIPSFIRDWFIRLDPLPLALSLSYCPYLLSLVLSYSSPIEFQIQISPLCQQNLLVCVICHLNSKSKWNLNDWYCREIRFNYLFSYLRCFAN